MAKDYYSDGNENDTPTEAPAEEKSNTESEKPTFLISKEAFGGREVEPGDTEEIKILRVMDDQVEAVCTYGEEDKSEEGGEEREPMMGNSSAPMPSFME